MDNYLKRSISVSLIVALAGFILGCRSEPIVPELIDSSIAIACTPYADQIASYTQGGVANANEAARPALGAPDQMTVPLVQDTVLTVIFSGLGAIRDNPGDDIRIHAQVESGATVAVYAGATLDNMPYIGEININTSDLTLSTGSISSATYVQLVGLTGTTMVDALESTQTLCPPP